MNNQKQAPFALILIPSALVLGATFFMVIVFTAMKPNEIPVGSESLQKAMLTIFLVMYFVCSLSSYFFPNIILKKGDITLPKYLTAILVRFALLEGVTFFGLVVVLQYHMGSLYDENAYLGLLGYFTLVITFALSIPSLISKMKTLA